MLFFKRAYFTGILNEKGRKKSSFYDFTDAPSIMPISFSRSTGLLGAICLGVFIWCLGLLILADHPMIKNENLAQAAMNIITAGAALFAPYAFNQISSLIPSKSTAQSGPITPDVALALSKPPQPPAGL